MVTDSRYECARLMLMFMAFIFYVYGLARLVLDAVVPDAIGLTTQQMDVVITGLRA